MVTAACANTIVRPRPCAKWWGASSTGLMTSAAIWRNAPATYAASNSAIASGFPFASAALTRAMSRFINRAATLPKKLVELEVVNMSPGVVKGIETFGNVIFWIVVAAFAAWVISKFIVNLNVLRGEDEKVEPVLVKEEA